MNTYIYQPNECIICFPWLNDPAMATHSPIFPDEDWEVIQQKEFQVGLDHFAYRGSARCRGCGRVQNFDCSYPEGYYFPARNWQKSIWDDTVTQEIEKRKSEHEEKPKR